VLARELHVRNIDDLEKAIHSGRLNKLPGIKAKTIENITKGIELVRAGLERLALSQAQAIAEEFVRDLERVPQVERVVCAGSLRRQKPTVRDIDILVLAIDAQPVMDAFVSLPCAYTTQAWGKTKSSVRTAEGVQVDCRVVEKKSFGAALMYFTGSKEFNVHLRALAQKMRCKINEYGVFDANDKFVCGRSEEEIFKFMKMQYIPPELREDTGEIEAALKGLLPRLIEQADIKGDLHVHSTWSDGASTIEEIARAAQKAGYSYVAISDHSQGLKVAHGVSIKDLAGKRKEIDAVNEKMKPFRVFFGTEVDIGGDGKLDYPDNILKEFEIVIAAIHTAMKQPASRITQRLIKACENPYVHIIAHPSGILRGVRDAYEFDLEAVMKKARETNTALEVNSFPDRMDLNDKNCRQAKEMGVKLCINTDSHNVEQLSFIRFGLAMARRGWISREDVLNTSNEGALPNLLRKK